MGSKFAGKTVLVTGSTSGIGLGIARAFAAEGANVMMNGLGEPRAIEALLAGLVKEFGVRALYHPADMTKPDEIAELVATAEQEFGAVDILVNNAGIQHVAPVDEFPVDKWDAILAINLSSAFHATRAALPGMKRRGWGRVINVASIHGLVASPYKSAYVAAKHGVVGFTKSVALEVAEQGITVNAICPGYVMDAHRGEAAGGPDPRPRRSRRRRSSRTSCWPRNRRRSSSGSRRWPGSRSTWPTRPPRR